MEKKNVIHELERINKSRDKDFKGEKISQQQFYDMLLSRELSWQEIIYDLILTSQLDPWDIDLALLASSYLKKINELEEANFFLSSKVLLAASILLRIKSEILLNKYMRTLDEILFGKPESKYKPLERIQIGEMPGLFPKTPLPRLKRVTITELIDALERAMNTEHRRIRKEILFKQAERSATAVLPRTKINMRDKIREVYSKIKLFFKSRTEKKMSYTELAGMTRQEKISAFLPTLHLSGQERILLEQEKHFEEIYISLGNNFRGTEILGMSREQSEQSIQLGTGEERIEKEIQEELEERKKSASEIIEDVQDKMSRDKEEGRAILN